MPIPDHPNKLRQVQLIFWINLAMAFFALSVFVKCIDSKQTWRIVCSGMGLAIILCLVILLLAQILRLQKKSMA